METGLFAHVAALQFQVASGKPKANLATVKRLLKSCRLPKGTLVVLPELWSTGFDIEDYTRMAATTTDVLEKLAIMAAESGLVFAGSLLETSFVGDDQGNPYNSLFVVDGNGVVGCYRKQHLFPFWKEGEMFTAGNRPALISTPQGDLGPLVCYDIRFGDLARGHAGNGASLLIVSAQWPESRVEHWRILLQARAIENQVFVAACNSCGSEGKNIFAGHSMIVAPDGHILAEAGKAEEILKSTLDPQELLDLRSRFCSVGERPWLRLDIDKICTLEELVGKVQKIRRQGSRVAFTNGCFDLLHSGHVSYLEQARSSADLLIVGVNSDRSVRSLKGDGRPVNSEQDRARVLASLGCVDFVVLFDEDTPQRLISTLLPDVLVKGADWSEDEIVGAPEVKAAGGRVLRVAFEHQCSTTALIKKIQR